MTQRVLLLFLLCTSVPQFLCRHVTGDTWVGPDPDQLDALFNRLDRNGDNVVDEDEFFYLEEQHVNDTERHFAATDFNEDGNLTMDEMIAREAVKQVHGDPLASPFKARDHFTRLDTNRDGIVSFDEYLRRDPRFTEELRGMFPRVDANGDEQLTWDEFLSFSEREKARERAERRRNFEFVFRNVDDNRDGKVDIEELKELLFSLHFPDKTFRISSTPVEFSEVVKGFDVDRSGALDVDELFEFRERNLYSEMECTIGMKQ